MQLLSSIEVCRRTGASYRMLDYWCRTGALRPMIEARGSGTQRRWRHDQVAVVRAVVRLAELGAGMDVIERVTAYLDTLPEPMWAGPLFVSRLGQVSGEPTDHDGAYMVNLDACADKVLAFAG